MKKFWIEFSRRGLLSAAGGPLIVAIVYACLGANGVMDSLSPNEACLGILSSILLAFITAGSGAVYTLEKLPVLSAALLQAVILYTDYILIYLINGWLPQQWKPILGFTIIFVIGYTLIWLIIYCTVKAKTSRINAKLQHK